VFLVVNPVIRGLEPTQPPCRSAAAGIPVAQLAPVVREGTSKKKVGVQVARISKMTDLGSGSSVKLERKSWDDPTVSLGMVMLGSVMKYKSKVDKDTILRA
jgi:hypothetical protein